MANYLCDFLTFTGDPVSSKVIADCYKFGSSICTTNQTIRKKLHSQTTLHAALHATKGMGKFDTRPPRMMYVQCLKGHLCKHACAQFPATVLGIQSCCSLLCLPAYLHTAAKNTIMLTTTQLLLNLNVFITMRGHTCF